MRVGVLDGDLRVEVDESGEPKGTLILSTAYNVIPLWLRIARDQWNEAKRASESVRTNLSSDDGEVNRELLVGELEASLQVFVACGIALDALYDQVRPFTKVGAQQIKAWKKNRTARAARIVEVLRTAYRLVNDHTAAFRKNISGIISFRDNAVHPSLELRQTCIRPDIPVGVDWKFSAYKFTNADVCFQRTMQMILYLYDKTSGIKDLDEQMTNLIKALEQLKILNRKAAC